MSEFDVSPFPSYNSQVPVFDLPHEQQQHMVQPTQRMMMGYGQHQLPMQGGSLQKGYPSGIVPLEYQGHSMNGGNQQQNHHSSEMLDESKLVAKHLKLAASTEQDDDDDDEYVPDPNVPENTGRWTREEHHMFLKGLEMHGKGWKKIAAFIKTRTVVQIRTHAQKYFLKLQKARQGHENNGVLIEGKSLFGGKRRKKRGGDKPMNLNSQLKPFFPMGESDEVIEKDADDGLYNFLSPPLEATAEQAAGPTMAELAQKIVKNSHKPTEWYQYGHGVGDLLREAEGLDWIQDSGMPLIIQQHRKVTEHPKLDTERKDDVSNRQGISNNTNNGAETMNVMNDPTKLQEKTMMQTQQQSEVVTDTNIDVTQVSAHT